MPRDADHPCGVSIKKCHFVRNMVNGRLLKMASRLPITFVILTRYSFCLPFVLVSDSWPLYTPVHVASEYVRYSLRNNDGRNFTGSMNLSVGVTARRPKCNILLAYPKSTVCWVLTAMLKWHTLQISFKFNTL